MHPVSTLGYQTPDAMGKLQRHMSAGAFLIDARFVPASRFRPAWAKKRLSERVGADNSCHAKGLGNAHYREATAEIKLHAPDDPQQGLSKVMKSLEERDVILLCACADSQQCHLAKVVELLRQQRPDLIAVPLYVASQAIEPASASAHEGH